MLSYYDIKNILRGRNQVTNPVDDFRIIDSYAIYDEDNDKKVSDKPLKYLCYEIESVNPETGEKLHFYKALKFARVVRLPKSAKQSTSFMDIQQQVLASVYQCGYNMITIIANIIKPKPIGLLFLYGVQGVADNIEDAKEKADKDFIGLTHALQGSFRVLEMKVVNAEETEWLREKMYNMEYMTVVRGVPKASRSGEDMGNKGVGGKNLNPDSQGTLEEFISGMADYEYVVQVLSTPVFRRTLQEWSLQTEKQMTAWNSQLQGTKALSFNISMPMMYMANQSNSEGWSKAYTDSESVSFSEGTSFSNSFSESVSHGLSESFSESFGVTNSQSVSNSVSQTTGTTFGQTVGQTLGQTLGQNVSASLSAGTSQSLSEGHSMNQSTSQNVSQTEGSTFGQSYSQGLSQSESVSHNMGTSHNTGVSSNESATFTDSTGSTSTGSKSGSLALTQGKALGQSYNGSAGKTFTGSAGDTSTNGIAFGEGTNWQVSGNASWKIPVIDVTIGGSSGGGGSTNVTQSTADGDTASQSMSASGTKGEGGNLTDTVSAAVTQSYSSSHASTSSHSESHGFTNGVSEGWGTNESIGVNSGMSASENFGLSQSTSNSQSVSNGISSGWGSSLSKNTGISNSQSLSQGQSVSQSLSKSVSTSQSVSNSVSVGQTVGNSVSQSHTQGTSRGTTDTVGQSQGITQGTSTSKGTTASRGTSTGTSGAYVSGASSSMGFGPSVGYNKSYQWLDQQVKDILELLEYQNERIKKSLRGEGAFYSYVYIACPSKDALAAAAAVAKSTWQNEYAMVNPLQVLKLTEEEQKHLLYHFAAFSADVTRESVGGVMQYKYSTILLPQEYCAYTHLPRISEGGVFADVNDIPKFAVPSQLKGEIYMGSILSAERYTMLNGYNTPFDYRIDESELMHGFFTGASRSGKTVAAMRFVAELANIRRKNTGKRLRIVCMDPKQDWRTLARFVDSERFRFYSLGNCNFRPVKINPFKIPRGVVPQTWIDGVIDIYCRAYGLLERGKQMMGETIYALYEDAGVFEACDTPGWEEKVADLSREVTFTKVYKKMESIKARLEDPTNPKGRAGNDTRDAYARLLDRLQCFSRPFSVETKLFGTSEGIGIDEMIGDDDVTILESSGLEKTFKNFIFGVITSGFYKYAKAREGGYLAEDQYETVLVIEEANEVLLGNDCAGSGAGASMGMTVSGQSEFEEILDQSAGYGLFIIAITQKIADMPKSIIANSGLVFAGRLKTQDDITVVIRSVAREERYDDRDLVKWFPRMATGMFVCQRSRTFDFKDAEPILVRIARLNAVPPTNLEIDEMLSEQEAKRKLTVGITA